MDTIGGRIAWVIAESGLTKTAFSEKLNVSQSFVSRLATGEKAPSDRTIADICRTFNVSEVWLRTGEGEPYIQLTPDEEFVRVCEEINLSEDGLIKQIIRSYWALSDKDKEVIRKLVSEISEGIKKAPDESGDSGGSPPVQ